MRMLELAARRRQGPPSLRAGERPNCREFLEAIRSGTDPSRLLKIIGSLRVTSSAKPGYLPWRDHRGSSAIGLIPCVSKTAYRRVGCLRGDLGPARR